MRKYASGIVLGKFMPLHKGHQHLIDMASRHSKQLTVLVCSLSRQPIPGQLRYRWMKQAYPDLQVVHVDDDSIPQQPHEHPQFWQIWTNLIRSNTPSNLECIFSSEPYGKTLGDLMKIQHFDVDLNRSVVPISGTRVRQKPLSNWEYISEAARPYFVKKVVVMGPESAGKTVLCGRLARKYNTEWVAQYGRQLSQQKPDLQLSDFPTIVQRQIDLEQRALPLANRLLFCDTECLTTMIFSRMYFPDTSHTLRQFFNQAIAKYSQRYSLYLLLKPFGEGHQDGVRLFLHKRQQHFRTIKQELEQRGLPYLVIDQKDYQANYQAACRAIDHQILSRY